MSYIYLASPFAHEDPKVSAHRAELAARHTAFLFDKFQTVYSPIVHHAITVSGYMQKVHHPAAFWLMHDLEMLRHAHTLYVLMIEGWEKSKGIMVEVKFAQGRMPIIGCFMNKDPSGIIKIETDRIHPDDKEKFMNLQQTIIRKLPDILTLVP
jgi:hypothetical protein